MQNKVAIIGLGYVVLQECFEYLGYKKGDFSVSEIVSNEIMSLPMNSYLSDEKIKYIAENL